MTDFVRSGIIWDVETTGLDPETDVIIELGAVKFEWVETVTEDMHLVMDPKIVSMYGGLSDPGRPLPDLIKKLTGITDQDLVGKSLEYDLLHEWAQDATIHVAHNAEFDKQFIRKAPFFSGITESRWGCTIKHIDWIEKDFKSTALGYLASDHGFVNPFPHRALFDCATAFRLMKPHFLELLQNHTKKMFRVSAWRAPFEMKDALRDRKYYWDAPNKVWRKDVLENKVESEQQFLTDIVYGHRSNPHTAEELAI